jgi:hypothetical protein
MKSNKGFSHVLTVIIVFITLLLFLAVFEFFRISEITQKAKQGFSDALLSIATENLIVSYKDLREIDFDKPFAINYSLGDIKKEISKELRGGNFELKNLKTQVLQQKKEERYIAKAEAILTIPLSSPWNALPPFSKKIEAETGIQAKF